MKLSKWIFVGSLLVSTFALMTSQIPVRAQNTAPVNPEISQVATRVETVIPVFPPAPRLAYTREELVALKASTDFPTTRDAATKLADSFVANPVTLPEGYGGWIFDYACPDDGNTLRALSPREHQCPGCKKVYDDEKIVGAYRGTLHMAAENAAEALGRAYAFSNDEKYANEVKRIIVFFARAYPAYPMRRDRWGNVDDFAPLGGRRYVQSLDEAVGIIRLAKAYDLTRNSSAWSREESTLIEDQLFGLTAQTLLQFNQDINNHQTWYNAGLMAIASVLGDVELVNKVLSMQGGFYDQLNRSLGSDGLWYEGTMAYQSYALQALVEIVEAGRRMGLDLHDTPRFKKLLLSPLHAAYPNGQFPAINDSDQLSVGMFQWSFDWAKKNYKQPLDTSLSSQSENLPDAGLVILRQGTGPKATCAILDYGPHGGGHGHFDKLNLMLFANNREWLLDPGRLSYSHKEYKTWVKETAAHNTVTWNGKSQQPTKGELLWLQSGDGWSASAAQSSGAYQGVVLRRYLFLTNQMLADVYEVEADKVGQIDWFAHAIVPVIAPVENMGASTPQTPGASFGYQHLESGQMWGSQAVSRWDFVADGKNSDGPRLRLWLADSEPEQIFTAAGIGYNIGQKAPTIIRRRNAKSTRFITVYDLSGKGNYVQRVTALRDSKAPLVIKTLDGTREILFTNTALQTSSLK